MELLDCVNLVHKDSGQSPVMFVSGAVLFPLCSVPLRIFEPRYTSMLDDALESSRTFILSFEEEDNFEKYLENMAIQMQMKPEELHDALKTSGRLMDVRADIAKEAALQWVFDRVNLLDEDGNTVDSGILEIKQPDIPDIAQKISENNDVEADDLSDDDLVSEQIIDEDNNDGEN